ncbi:MAG: hypothetical protein AB7U38_08860 [Hyphomicrobiales bacterium]|uniref:hypothetical protein n=1 Tax=Pseudorhodoplanes sp. TaxID=1934341 RepID=UPI003D0E2224
MSGRRPGRRATEYLSIRHINELQAAFEFAEWIELPLNLFVTIAWIHTDAVQDPDGRLLAALLERVRKMFLRRDITPAFLWVREWQPGRYGMNDHAHILIHIPVAFFERNRLKHITEIFERQLVNVAGDHGDRALRLKRWTYGGAQYLVKGCRPEVRDQLRLPSHRSCEQGTITGKRSAASQNLGPAARRRFWADLNGAPARKAG